MPQVNQSPLRKLIREEALTGRLCPIMTAAHFRDQRPVGSQARLGRPHERLAIHRDQPEARNIARRPFEIVKQAPMHIAEHRSSARNLARQAIQRRA